MKEEEAQETNIEMLLAKLKPESLASALTAAHQTPGDKTPSASMGSVLEARIAHVREALDEPQD